MNLTFSLLFAMVVAIAPFAQPVLSQLTGPQQLQAQPSAPTSQVPLRIGIFSDADSLPLIVAEKEGFFQRAGVAVDLVWFSSAMERDSALQAGKLDGAVTDALAVILANNGGFPLKITSLTNGRYGVAVSPHSGIQSMKGLEGKNVAVSLNTSSIFLLNLVPKRRA